MLDLKTRLKVLVVVSVMVVSVVSVLLLSWRERGLLTEEEQKLVLLLPVCELMDLFMVDA